MHKIIIELLIKIIELASPEIRKALNEMISTLENKAKKTPNPADDILVYILKAILE